MTSRASRLVAVLVAVAIAAVGIGLYVNKFTRAPAPFAATRSGQAQAQLTLAGSPTCCSAPERVEPARRARIGGLTPIEKGTVVS